MYSIKGAFAPAIIQLCSLGAGNHFISLERSELTGDIYLIIHGVAAVREVGLPSLPEDGATRPSDGECEGLGVPFAVG